MIVLLSSVYLNHIHAWFQGRSDASDHEKALDPQTGITDSCEN